MPNHSRTLRPRRSARPVLAAWLAVATMMLAAGGALAQSARPPGGTTEVTLGYAGGGNIDTYFQKVLADAATALPDIKITPVVSPTYDDQLNQLPTQFAAGTVPDVIMWDNSAPVAEYASEQVILPLDDLIAGTSIDLSAYPQALVEGWKIDGKLYAIPAYLQNSAFVFNQGLLTDAGITTLPTSMDEVRAAAKTVKEKTGKAGIVILDNLFHLYQYMLAFGGGFDFGRTINSPENVAGLQFLVDMFVTDQTAQTAQQLGATWDGDAISKNLAAMSDGGPWYIGFMQSTAPNVKYDLLPIPSNKPDQPFVVTYGGGYTITDNAKDPAAAMRVVEYLTNEASEEAIITTGLGFVPAMTKFLAEYTAATPEYAAFTEDVLANGKTLAYPPNTTAFGNDLVAGFEQLALQPGSGTVQQLLDTLQSTYGQSQ
jgi:multiple sugar transport system substrate-binding protein